MASEWRQRKIGDIIACNTDTYSPKEKWPFVNYLDTGNITKGTIDSFQLITDHDALPTRARRKVQPGDIVYSTVRPNQNHYGIIKQPLPNMLVSTGFAVIRGVQGECDTRFLYYYLTQLTIIDYLHSVGENSTSAYPSVRPTDIESLDICLPPLSIQMRIADILGKLDDKIELNRRMNRTLEKMAAAIFKSWFIDFDPVHAKAEGRDPNLPAEISNLFPDSFEDSALGPIPKGWKLKAIGDAVRCVGGATPSTKTPEFWEGGRHPFVTPKDMSSLQSPVILDSERHITDAGVEKISSKQLPVGTVILSSRAPIGYLGVATVPVSVNQGVIAMICDRDLPNLYVLNWTAVNMDLIKSRSGGTTFAEISKQNFRPIPALVPNTPVLEAFMANVAPLHERISLNVRQCRRLAGLRDTLLPKLLSGEIELPEVAALVERGT